MSFCEFFFAVCFFFALTQFWSCISLKWSKNSEKKSQNDILHVKTSPYVKKKQDPVEKKSPKSDIYPFCGKPFNWKCWLMQRNTWVPEKGMFLSWIKAGCFVLFIVKSELFSRCRFLLSLAWTHGWVHCWKVSMNLYIRVLWIAFRKLNQGIALKSGFQRYALELCSITAFICWISGCSQCSAPFK